MVVRGGETVSYERGTPVDAPAVRVLEGVFHDSGLPLSPASQHHLPRVIHLFIVCKTTCLIVCETACFRMC